VLAPWGPRSPALGDDLSIAWLYDKGGELALQEISLRKPCITNRVEEHIEKAPEA
jgi:hypothetical protein